MGNGEATIIQRHMEFNGGIAYGIDRLLEPPDLGSRCDEFTLLELQVKHLWSGPPVQPCAWEKGCLEGLLLFLGKALSSQERQQHRLSCCEVSFSPPQASPGSCGLCGFEPPCPAGSVQGVKLTALSPGRLFRGLMATPMCPSCFSSKMKAHPHVASPWLSHRVHDLPSHAGAGLKNMGSLLGG